MKENEIDWKDKLSEGHIDFIKRTYAEMIAYQIVKNKMKEKEKEKKLLNTIIEEKK